MVAVVLQETIDILKMKPLAIYNNFASSELGNPDILARFAKEEHSLISFKTKIYIDKRGVCCFSIISEARKHLGIKKGDAALMRFKYKDKCAVDISKIGDWGRTTISKSLAQDFIHIKDGEEINIDILQISKNKLEIEHQENSLDLTIFLKDGFLFIRPNNFITFYKAPIRPITIPRFIEKNSELLETLYLIWGDGNYDGKLYLANKCPELHLKLISYFENYLKIPKEFWKLRILLTNKENYDEAKAYWFSKLHFEKEQLYPTISNAVLKTTKVGNARIVLENKAIAELIENLLNFANSNLNKFSLKERLHVLNGLLMAEGGTDVTNGNKGLHYLSISHSEDEKELFEKIIRFCGLDCEFKRVRKDMLKASGWKILYDVLKKFAENGVVLMKNHPQRLQKILTFLDHSYVKSMNTYLLKLKENDRLTNSDFVKLLNCDPSSVSDYFKKYSRFVRISGKGTKFSPRIYKLSEEGEKFVQTIKDIENWKEVSYAKTAI
ncbi:MAG: hypothetical protein V1839_01575 [archaeon]